MSRRFTLRSAPLAAWLLFSLYASSVFGDVHTYQQSLQATVFIRSQDGHGTGVLVDAERRLVVTAAHVVKGGDAALVIFPRVENGSVVRRAESYFDDIEAGLPSRQLLDDGGLARGRVLWSDLQRDLAVVQLESVPNGAPAMPLADDSPLADERVYAIGNATLMRDKCVFTSVAGLVYRVHDANVSLDGGAQHLDARIVDVSMAVDRGDSGGPLVNGRGQLIGIASFKDPFLVALDGSEHRGGCYIDLREIRLALRCAELLGVIVP